MQKIRPKTILTHHLTTTIAAEETTNYVSDAHEHIAQCHRPHRPRLIPVRNHVYKMTSQWGMSMHAYWTRTHTTAQ